MINAFCHVLFLLIAGHALADGPLQVGNITKGKSSGDATCRAQALVQHGLIHGGAVALITGLWWLGAAEAVLHTAIDAAKGRRIVSHLADQVLHIGLKVVWASIVIYSGAAR